MKIPSHKRPSGAFTLIELLTVIAIVGILSAILIPVVGNIRERSATTKDMAKIKSIGHAIAMHVADNNGRLPNPETPIRGTKLDGDDQTDRWNFYEAVDRYMDPPENFNPRSIYNYNRRDTWYSESADQSPEGDPRYLGFAPNPHMLRTFGGAASWMGYTTKVPELAKMVLVTEVTDVPGSGRYDLNPSVEPTVDPLVASQYRASRPGGAALYLFGDYRVELLEGNQGSSVKPEIWFWED
ncbi:MAG: type II secretion system protein [Verrucomicrobiota bacterium]